MPQSFTVRALATLAGRHSFSKRLHKSISIPCPCAVMRTIRASYSIAYQAYTRFVALATEKAGEFFDDMNHKTNNIHTCRYEMSLLMYNSSTYVVVQSTERPELYMLAKGPVQRTCSGAQCRNNVHVRCMESVTRFTTQSQRRTASALGIPA